MIILPATNVGANLCVRPLPGQTHRSAPTSNIDVGRKDDQGQILNQIAGIDKFKGDWKAIGNLAPERLDALKRVATIESIGSSTRIEGVTLTDYEIEKLLSGLDRKSFKARDEQEVAGYADVMDIVFESSVDIFSAALTENHIKQLHNPLLQHSVKDIRHWGEYKKMPNHVEAFDHDGKSLGGILETTSPFDTPRHMEELVKWVNWQLKEKELHPLLTIREYDVAVEPNMIPERFFHTILTYDRKWRLDLLTI